ncbi:hypothetical protein BG004_003394, partial [Podila humilis]
MSSPSLFSQASDEESRTIRSPSLDNCELPKTEVDVAVEQKEYPKEPEKSDKAEAQQIGTSDKANYDNDKGGGNINSSNPSMNPLSSPLSDTKSSLQVKEDSVVPSEAGQAIKQSNSTVATNPNNTVTPKVGQKAQDGLAMLLERAIAESPKTQMTVGEMCAWIVQRLPTDSCHSLTMLQTLIHHSLTQNKAFKREEPSSLSSPSHPLTIVCTSEIWTLHLNAPQSTSPLVPAKRKTVEPSTDNHLHTFGTNSDNMKCSSTAAQSVVPVILASNPILRADALEDTPSPSADDSGLQPRRSGRSRRPPKAKESDDYVIHSIHLTNNYRRHTPPHTPPTSPPPPAITKESSGECERPPIKKRASVKFDKRIAITQPHPPPSPSPTIIDPTTRRTTTPIAEDSNPLVINVPRVRRPPPNLAEFVSSENFRSAASCNRRPDRADTISGHGPTTTTTGSMLSGIAQTSKESRIGVPRPVSIRSERRDKKRSKSDASNNMSMMAIPTADVSTSASRVYTPPTHHNNSNDHDHMMSGSSAPQITPSRAESPSETTTVDQLSARSSRSPSAQCTAASERKSPTSRLSGPLSIPLSALSHTKRRSEDFSSCFKRPAGSDMGKKRQRR